MKDLLGYIVFVLLVNVIFGSLVLCDYLDDQGKIGLAEAGLQQCAEERSDGGYNILWKRECSENNSN